MREIRWRKNIYNKNKITYMESIYYYTYMYSNIQQVPTTYPVYRAFDENRIPRQSSYMRGHCALCTLLGKKTDVACCSWCTYLLSLRVICIRSSALSDEIRHLSFQVQNSILKNKLLFRYVMVYYYSTCGHHNNIITHIKRIYNVVYNLM